MSQPFDFDQITDRRGSDSLKWGVYSPDILPLWGRGHGLPLPACGAESAASARGSRRVRLRPGDAGGHGQCRQLAATALRLDHRSGLAGVAAGSGARISCRLPRFH